MNKLLHSLIHSFIHSFLHSFIRSFILTVHASPWTPPDLPNSIQNNEKQVFVICFSQFVFCQRWTSIMKSYLHYFAIQLNGCLQQVPPTGAPILPLGVGEFLRSENCNICKKWKTENSRSLT